MNNFKVTLDQHQIAEVIETIKTFEEHCGSISPAALASITHMIQKACEAELSATLEVYDASDYLTPRGTYQGFLVVPKNNGTADLDRAVFTVRDTKTSKLLSNAFMIPVADKQGVTLRRAGNPRNDLRMHHRLSGAIRSGLWLEADQRLGGIRALLESSAEANGRRLEYPDELINRVKQSILGRVVDNVWGAMSAARTQLVKDFLAGLAGGDELQGYASLLIEGVDGDGIDFDLADFLSKSAGNRDELQSKLRLYQTYPMLARLLHRGLLRTGADFEPETVLRAFRSTTGASAQWANVIAPIPSRSLAAFIAAERFGNLRELMACYPSKYLNSDARISNGKEKQAGDFMRVWQAARYLDGSIADAFANFSDELSSNNIEALNEEWLTTVKALFAKGKRLYIGAGFGYLRHLGEAADPIIALTRELTLPALRLAQPAVEAPGQNLPFTALLGTIRMLRGRTLPELEAISRRWHEEQATNDRTLTAVRGGGSWSALHDKVVLADGSRSVCFEALNTASELFDEGQAMRHCVASYAEACILRGTHITSMKDENGNRIATLELRFDTTGSIKLMQIKGPENTAVSEADLTLAEEFVGRLGDIALLTYERNEAERSSRENSLKASGAMESGYDISNPEARRTVLRMWQKLAPELLSGRDWGAVQSMVREVTQASTNPASPSPRAS